MEFPVLESEMAPLRRRRCRTRKSKRKRLIVHSRIKTMTPKSVYISKIKKYNL